MECIATFYSHFGAIRYKKECEKTGVQAVIMPVPRSLSSSCGTCVKFTVPGECHIPAVNEEMEQVVEVTGSGYRKIYQAEDA